MAVENWQKETRDAMWESLHAEADWLAEFGTGTECHFDAKELLQRYEVLPGKCPFIAIAPQNADLVPISRATKGAETDSYKIRVELAHRSLEEVEQLVTAFHAAMGAQWERLARVRNNRLYQIDCSVEWDQQPHKDSPRPLGFAALTLTCRYRAA
jgi:hypothetical protein